MIKNVRMVSYDELPEEDKECQPNHSYGKECAHYLIIEWENGGIQIESDCMEPEDVRFYRDLSWIKDTLLRQKKECDLKVAELQNINNELFQGLKKIFEIKNQTSGGVWDEIEEARSIAKELLTKNNILVDTSDEGPLREIFNTLKDKMIFLDGSDKSFRCSCGCNVFKEYLPMKYRCNGCHATYTGEK